MVSPHWQCDIIKKRSNYWKRTQHSLAIGVLQYAYTRGKFALDYISIRAYIRPYCLHGKLYCTYIYKMLRNVQNVRSCVRISGCKCDYRWQRPATGIPKFLFIAIFFIGIANKSSEGHLKKLACNWWSDALVQDTATPPKELNGKYPRGAQIINFELCMQTGSRTTVAMMVLVAVLPM